MKKYPIDLILMNGDFVGHDIALEKNVSNAEAIKNWKNKQLLHFIEVQNLFRKQFPYTTILPTIGNNDVIYHNKYPC